jgi:hypothetical protein
MSLVKKLPSITKLSFGRNISTGSFFLDGHRTINVLAYGYSHQAQWSDFGVGFIGFRFNSGAGGEIMQRLHRAPSLGWIG